MAETKPTTPHTTFSPEELRQAGLAEVMVSSESFMWLMQGVGDWTQAHIEALQKLYRAWHEESGGYVRYNGLSRRLLEAAEQAAPKAPSEEPA